MNKIIDDPEVIHRFVRERLADYQRTDYTKERAELVAEWKHHHPEAATEQSQAHHSLELSSRRGSGPNPENEPDEIWFSDIYSVTLRRHQEDRVFGTRSGMIELGINTLDGTARHDWREFQAIKNQLAGEECEAFELYPAESRRLDPSNYYTLWCFPGLKRIKVGREYRRVWDHDQALAPQRALPQDDAKKALV